MVCWMSHGDHVEAPLPGFDIIAATENIPIAAMRNREKGLYAVQFHPEVVICRRKRACATSPSTSVVVVHPGP